MEYVQNDLATRLLVVPVAALVLTLPGCGGSNEKFDPINLDDNRGAKVRTDKKPEGVARQKGAAVEDDSRPYPLLATKNSTRIFGNNAIEDAAFTARVVYPSKDRGSRPEALIFVDKDSWQSGVAASSLVSKPISAPILLSEKGSVPEITNQTAKALQPTGLRIGKSKRKIKAIGIGAVATPDGLIARKVTGKGPAEIAASIDRLSAKLRAGFSKNVVIVSSKSAAYASPAAAWAAKSGDPILFVKKKSIPKATKSVLAEHKKPNIYVLAPKKLVTDVVVEKLRELGQVQRIGQGTAVQSAIDFARYQAFEFGWGVSDPGHGLVFMNVSRPLDAAASAPLAASGKYGPLLLVNRSTKLPKPVRNYLLDIQPGYEADPSRGVYNHAWIIGSDKAISTTVQAQIDMLTEIQKVKQEPGVRAIP